MQDWKILFIWILLGLINEVHGNARGGSVDVLGVPPGASHEERLVSARSFLHQTTLLVGARRLRWPLEGSKNSTQARRTSSLQGLLELQRSKVAAQMWSLEVPCGAQYRNAVQLLLEQLDALKRIINAHARYDAPPRTV
ncbi:uncharacterized protein LOC108666697 [Hyalella azteca]|uniref:Dipeptidase n=1 Tax=Hyalella azteca TaxID=294128 RepID=A0A8B7N746_HYAAZ|nr:uncharacterized protein LOC108666697 [Hyalella azteca]